MIDPQRLADFATAEPSPSAKKQTGTSKGIAESPEALRSYLENHGESVRSQKSLAGGAVALILNGCPMNGDHGRGTDTAIIWRPDGIGFECKHDSCSHFAWPDVRARIDPARSGTVPRYSSPLEAEVASSDWADPKPLLDELPAVMLFDYELLPVSLRAWIRDIAERLQCPPDFPAIAAMITTATVVGRKVGILPKRHDDWVVVPNLWGAAIGPPSVMKTPALQEPLRPLLRLEIEAKAEFEAAQQDVATQKLVAEQRQRLAKNAIKTALKDGNDPHVAARDALPDDLPPPVRRRYVVNDSTIEKLGETLNQNPNGVLCYRDELIGLLKSLDKEGQEGARSAYLELWNGTGRYTYDRIGRGTIDIEAAIVSVLGSIQPGPLRAYLRGAVSDGANADGLMQRFQLAVYPDTAKTWQNVDRCPDTDARNRASEVIHSLDQLEPASIGAEVVHEITKAIPCIRFDSAAQQQFDAWRESLEQRLRSGAEHPVMEAHLAKYRSLIPSLALLCHLAEGCTGAVGNDALQRAIAWGRYLESHARRIYSAAIAPDTSEANALARKILTGDLPAEFALRDVYRPGWIGLGTREAASRAVEVLCDLDWLTEVQQPTQTKQRTRYLVNPRLRQTHGNATDKTDKSHRETAPGPNLSDLSVRAAEETAHTVGESSNACAPLDGDGGENGDTT